MLAPVGPRDSLKFTTSLFEATKGTAIKSTTEVYVTSWRSLISSGCISLSIECFPEVTLTAHLDLIYPPIFISILIPLSNISYTIPTAFPSSK